MSPAFLTFANCSSTWSRLCGISSTESLESVCIIIIYSINIYILYISVTSFFNGFQSE